MARARQCGALEVAFAALSLGLGPARGYPVFLQSCQAWAPGDPAPMAALTFGNGSNAGTDRCVVDTSALPSGGFVPGRTYQVDVRSSELALYKLHSSDGQCLGRQYGYGMASAQHSFAWTAPPAGGGAVTIYALCGQGFETVNAAAPVQLSPAQAAGAGALSSAAPRPPRSRGVGSAVGLQPSGMQGVNVSFWQDRAGALVLAVEVHERAWVGLGLSKGAESSMNGDGNGADVVVCSDGEVRRHWVTEFSVPSQGGQLLADAECAQEAGVTRLRFSRPLAAGARQRAITPGAKQQVTVAHGADSEEGVEYHVDRRGAMLVDFATGATEQLSTFDGVLMAHLCLMLMAWGFCLPMGATIARFAKGVRGAPDEMWFKLHKRFQVVGWLLQLAGAVAGVLYTQQSGTHFGTWHQWVGAIVVALATLQPLNALLRPHRTEVKSFARLCFEAVHKSCGWASVAFGFPNMFLGAALLAERGFGGAEVGAIVAVVAVGGCAVLLFGGLGLVNPNNASYRWLLGAKQVWPPCDSCKTASNSDSESGAGRERSESE